jgi:serine/threonine protein kinase/Tfp pilus assembly protein PilF
MRKKASVKCPKCNFENPADTHFCGKCAEPLEPQKDISVLHTKTLTTSKRELNTGSTFAGRYQVIEELGKGGMGRVYKALDKEINEKVAIKLLNPEVGSDEETIERFKNELRLARKVGHRNVCRMYDIAQEEGAYYISMEYISGEDLKSFIVRSGQLTVGKAVSIAKQVCEGLSEAHRLGVVHRDLKPQNIMIDKEGNARIMDFGIARSLKVKGITGAGVMIGTPEYMSPEQVEVKDVDQRSDIYSLGVILYEMVTGRVPFEGETPLGVAMKHKTEAPRNPRELNSQIPEDLSRVILRCLEKEKEKRYQSAGELRSELERIESGMPTTERIVPKRRPSTSREITVTFNLRKLFIPALVIAALVAAAVIIWQLLPRREALPIPSGKPSVAIIYFKNNTGDEKFDHWRTALSDLLIADLAQSKYIHVLSGDSLYNILRQLDLLEARSYSREELEKVASRGRVNHIIQGDLSKAGDNFRINIVLQEAGTGELIGSESVDGKGEESMLSMVDELTRRIKANFKLSEKEIATDIDKKVEKITTSSPQALRYYNEGRDFHHKAEYRKSIQMMEKALAIDPEFAMAYRSMAMSYNNLLVFSEKEKYLQKAFELKDRLSDRERYLIEGEFYRYSEMTYDKSIEAYTDLLRLYPDDDIGNTNLGILYMSTEQWDKAIELLNIQIQNREESFFPYVNITEAYRAKGMYETARKVLEYYIQNVRESDEVRRELALNYFLQGEYNLALSEADKAYSLNPDNVMNLIIKGDIYLCTEDIKRAEEENLKVLETKELGYHLYSRVVLGALNLLQGKFESARQHYKQGLELAEKLGENWWKACFHLMLAYDYLKSGRPADVLKECDLAWKIAQDSDDDLRWQRRALYYKGRAFLVMNSIGEAQKAANDIKELVEKGANKKEMRLYHHLLGLVELEKKNYLKAIEYFKEAVSLLPHQLGLDPFTNDQAIFAEPLALAYYASGDKEKAQEEDEKILTMTTGKLYWGDIYGRSLYRLGKTYEEKGLKSKTIEHYQKFLKLWKDSDLGFAEVEDARKRLAELGK